MTPYSVLDHLLRSLSFNDVNDDKLRKHAETFAALAATEHNFSLRSPALIAAGCLGAALRGLHFKGLEQVLVQLQSALQIDKVS